MIGVRIVRIATLFLLVYPFQCGAQWSLVPSQDQIAMAVAELGVEQWPEDVLPMRTRLRDKIFGGQPIVGNIEKTPFVDYEGHPPLIDVAFNAEWWTHCTGLFCSRMIFLQPAVRTGTCLFAWHQGHIAGYENDGPIGGFGTDSTYSQGVHDLLTAVAAKGCDLLLFSMPLAGPNRADQVNVPGNDDIKYSHDFFYSQTGDPDIPGSAMHYFVGPELQALNQALTENSYTIVNAAGLSGGGQTTAIVAALEPRIQHSFIVSGIVPLPLFDPTNPLDYEVLTPDLWCSRWLWVEKGPIGCFTVADILLLGVVESTRAQIHLHGSCDPAYPSTMLQVWPDALAEHAAGYGFGSLIFDIEDGRCYHDVSPHGRDIIIGTIFP